MKDINYFTVQGWMVSKLKLKGNNLMVYSIIYGFSQDGESEFTGSIKYLCTWLSASRPTIIKALKELTALGYIIKRQKVVNHVYFNRYKVDLQVVKKLYRGSKETLQGGSKETLPNSNSLDNKLDNNKKTKTKKDLEVKPKLKRTKKTKSITPNNFNMFWELYPNKKSKGAALTAWNKLCNKQPSKRPIYTELENALELQKESDQWKNTQYIPMLSTWLNQSRWLDDPTLMKSYSSDNKNQKGKGLGTRIWTDDVVDYSEVKVHKYDPTKQ